MGVMKELYCGFCRKQSLFPTPALPVSGSKGIISAASGTPFFSGRKGRNFSNRQCAGRDFFSCLPATAFRTQIFDVAPMRAHAACRDVARRVSTFLCTLFYPARPPTPFYFRTDYAFFEHKRRRFLLVHTMQNALIDNVIQNNSFIYFFQWQNIVTNCDVA